VLKIKATPISAAKRAFTHKIIINPADPARLIKVNLEQVTSVRSHHYQQTPFSHILFVPHCKFVEQIEQSLPPGVKAQYPDLHCVERAQMFPLARLLFPQILLV